MVGRDGGMLLGVSILLGGDNNTSTEVFDEEDIDDWSSVVSTDPTKLTYSDDIGGLSIIFVLLRIVGCYAGDGLRVCEKV